MIELYKFRKIGVIQILASLMLIVSITSCEKDNELIVCNFETEVDLGEFSLLQKSRQSIPYIGNQIVYFKDELQNEIYFVFSEENIGYASIVHYGNLAEYECNDSVILQHQSATGDAFIYNLTEPQHLLNMTLHLRLDSNTQSLEFNDLLSGDFLTLSSGTEDDNHRYTLVQTLVDRRNLSDEIVSSYPTPIENVTLGGKHFSYVYTNETNSAYYNYEQGIIAFTDNEGKFWVYDRSENIE